MDGSIQLLIFFLFFPPRIPRYDDYVFSRSAGLIRQPRRGHAGFPLLKRRGRFLGFPEILQTVLDEIHECTLQRGASPLNKHLWELVEKRCLVFPFFFFEIKLTFCFASSAWNWVDFTHCRSPRWVELFEGTFKPGSVVMCWTEPNNTIGIFQ